MSIHTGDFESTAAALELSKTTATGVREAIAIAELARDLACQRDGWKARAELYEAELIKTQAEVEEQWRRAEAAEAKLKARGGR
jgi:hypothetical protein